MIDTPASASKTIVHDPKSGRDVVVHGLGALKGRLTIRKGLDLTKPIASQAAEDAEPSARDPVRKKR